MSSLTPPVPSPESRFDTLLRDARNGSAEARWMVVHLFRNAMLAIANEQVDRDVLCREAASDIVQETIVEAQRDLDGFRGETRREMRLWLRRVLVRNILNTIRKHRAGRRDVLRERPLADPDESRTGPVIPDPASSPSEVAGRRETVAALERAIEGLPSHYRQIIYMRYKKNMPYEAIARELGKTEEATRRLWSRVLRELSRRMRPHLG